MRIIGLLFWALAFLAQPALAADVPPHLQPLEQRLAALATENPGEYGFAALDLTTGDMVSFNGNRPFPMASTMKVAVAAVYLSQVDAGQRRLYDMIGDDTASSLLDRMMVHSDNHATDQLLAALGGPAVIDGWLRAHQLNGIRVDRTIAGLLGDDRDLWDIRDSSTPTAMLGLLRLLDTGDALTPQSRLVLLDMMRRCATGSNRIRGILPPGARVEHKTGTLNGYTGDVGYLTRPDGRRIAVVFFARGGENRPAVISTAARAIYDAFGTQGQAGLPTPWTTRVQTTGATLPRTAAPAPVQQTGAMIPHTAPPASACSLGGSNVQAQC